MAGRWTGTFSYVTGAPRDRQAGALALVSDELARRQIEHTVPLVWTDGTWKHAAAEKLDFTTVSVAVTAHPIRQAAYLGLHGNVFFIGAGDEHEEVVEAGAHSPKNIGMMRAIRNIEGEIYTVGMRRQVYRRAAPHRWEYVGPNQPSNRLDTTSFEAIDGFGKNEIYAAGREGEIWHFDGQTWNKVDSPTSAILTGMCCSRDGSVYICGRGGTIVRGRLDRWEVVEHETTKQDFWSIVQFDGRIFVATLQQLFELAGSDLRPLAAGTDNPRTCFHLATAADCLWSIGSKDVLSFDGTAWARID